MPAVKTRTTNFRLLPHLAYTAFFKRGLDIIGAAVLLVITFPLLLATVVLLKIFSPGPVLYSQSRLTKHGRLFTIYKFRTMTVDAETRSGAVWAQENDPRVTRFGAFLRRTRVDELPQLINVLMGDMSLVGPRPERPEFADTLSKQLPLFKKRLEVKAGITGLSQTRIGYASSIQHYRRKVAMDAVYVDNCCLLLDLRIAIQTVRIVLTGVGAR